MRQPSFRTQSSRAAALLLAVSFAALPTAARAETDVGNRLQPGGAPVVLTGTLRYGQVERYVFTPSRQGRLTVALSGTTHEVVVVELYGPHDDSRMSRNQFFTYRTEGRVAAGMRYTAIVRFHTGVRFAAPPPPSPYRLELKLE